MTLIRVLASCWVDTQKNVQKSFIQRSVIHSEKASRRLRIIFRSLWPPVGPAAVPSRGSGALLRDWGGLQLRGPPG